MYISEFKFSWTYTDKECHDNQHCCQIDGNNCLKIFIFIKVSCVTDNVENDGGDDDVEKYS